MCLFIGLSLCISQDRLGYMVAPNQLTGFSTEYQAVWNSVYIASILVAVVGTLLMAFHAKKPYMLFFY